MRFSFFYLSLLFLLLVTGPLPPSAAAAQAPPVRIEADRMESGEEPGSVVFSGQVSARRGELVIHAATMTIFPLSEEEQAELPQGDQRRIKKLYAEGEVRIEAEGWIGSGDFMEYSELERKVYLTGNARAWQDNNLISGQTITLYLDEDRTIVERGEGPDERVRAFFYADGDEVGPAPNPSRDSTGEQPPQQPEAAP